MNTNPIFIVDDDIDDHDILKEVMQELSLKNELIFFSNAEELLHELHHNPVVPFLIISDLNLPGMNGFELRKAITEDLEIIDKTVPFIFWSTAASEKQVREAFQLSAHGFFIKGRTYGEVKESMQEIIHYWHKSLSPQ